MTLRSTDATIKVKKKKYSWDINLWWYNIYLWWRIIGKHQFINLSTIVTRRILYRRAGLSIIGNRVTNALNAIFHHLVYKPLDTLKLMNYFQIVSKIYIPRSSNMKDAPRPAEIILSPTQPMILPSSSISRVPPVSLFYGLICSILNDQVSNTKNQKWARNSS